MTPSGRGHGLLRDPEQVVVTENAEQPLSKLVNLRMVGTPVRPARVDWRGYLDQILDQGPTNSCVGCAMSTAIYLRGQTSTAVRRPSAKAIYDQGRLEDATAQSAEDLDDFGCRPGAAMAAVYRQGLVAWEDWPLFTDDAELLALRPKPDTTWTNTPPPFDLFHNAYDARLTGHHRADFGAIDVTLELALAQGHIPLYGQVIRHDYVNVRGTEVYDIPTDADTAGLPSHMQAICGYDEASFFVVSSWGAGHGDQGIVRVAKRVLQSDWAFSRLVITQVPIGPSAIR